MSIKDLLYPFTAWKNFVREPVSIDKPRDREGAPRYRGFHVNNIDKCIGCGSCEDICQNAAIDLVPVEGIQAENGNSGLRPMIDYGRCCWCALCVDICPTGSLRMSNEHTWVEEDADVFRFIPGAEEKPWDSLDKGYTRARGYELVDLQRVHMGELHPEERDTSFIEIVKGYSNEEAKKEAERCLGCGICVSTCPAHMDIPEYIAKIRDDDIEGALRVVYETNPLPEVCGRVCTHRCEGVCALSHRGEPIAIRWLKRYIADQIPREDYARVLGHDFIEKVNKKIGIVGAGPAGLTTAYYLALMGYEITIFEEKDEAGGMMRYGIPEYRLPYDQLDKDIEYIKGLGVEIKTGVKIGRDITLQQMQNDFDVVFVGIGLHIGRSTGIPGSDHEDVFYSVDLLREITDGNEIKMPEKVVVIGGGNVAMDIARSGARLQKQKYGKVGMAVTSLESYDEMPADREELVEGDEEGVVFYPGRGPREVVIENGKIKGLRTIGVKRIFDEEGRFNPEYDEQDELLIEADMVVESIGQAPNMDFMPEDINSQLEYNGRRIAVNQYGQTSVKWLFMGGDVVQGPDVVTSIQNGHKAAIGIDMYLHGKKS